MGVEYKNEMDFYLWLARVDVGVITNISNTHTEFFGNEAGVLKEKVKLFKSLKKSNIGVINRGDESFRKIENSTKAKKIYFGSKGEVSAIDIETTSSFDTNFSLKVGEGEINVSLPVVGDVFVENALAASSVAFGLNVSLQKISRGLSSHTRPPHRMRISEHPSGAILLDDSYNNNPLAAISAINTLCNLAGMNKKVVVFGDMLELGRLEKSEHRRVGKYLVAKKIDIVIGVGEASAELVYEVRKVLGEKRSFHVGSSKKVLPLLYPYLKKDTHVLIKGSRSIGLNKLVTSLLKAS